ncbi:MAG: 30S ribosomal protein S16 [Polyangiaceae bacterium]
MAVHIRLSRAGTKKRPIYRLVVTDHRSPRGGKFLENIGTFDPSPAASRGKKDAKKVDGFKVDAARLAFWTGRGAQPSATVDRLLKDYQKANPDAQLAPILPANSPKKAAGSSSAAPKAAKKAPAAKPAAKK